MLPLWQRDNVYSKYLEVNDWVFKMLPNWVGSSNVQGKMYNVKLKKNNSTFYIINYTFDILEDFARWIQLKLMSKPKGMEKITDTALYFHPINKEKEILNKYNAKIKRIFGRA